MGVGQKRGAPTKKCAAPFGAQKSLPATVQYECIAEKTFQKTDQKIHRFQDGRHAFFGPARQTALASDRLRGAGGGLQPQGCSPPPARCL